MIEKDQSKNQIKKLNEEYHDREAEYYDDIHLHITEDVEVLQRAFENIDYQNKKILDIGTGTGFIPINLKTNSEFSCLDISKEMLKRLVAKTKNDRYKKINVIKGDAESLPISNESIDIVTFSSALHHLPNPEKCLEESYRVLKSGGFLFIFHEPNLNPNYFLVQYLRFLIKKTYNKQENRESKIKKLAKRVFSDLEMSEEDALRKMEECNKEANIQNGFDPFNLVDEKLFDVKKIQTYSPIHHFLDKLLIIIFPKCGELFYIIAKKLNNDQTCKQQ